MPLPNDPWSADDCPDEQKGATGQTHNTTRTHARDDLPPSYVDNINRTFPRSGRTEPRELPEPVSESAPHTGTAALIGICIGVALLILSGFLLVDRSNDPAPVPLAAPTAPVATATPTTTTPRTVHGKGVTFGKVVANDGTTLKVSSPFGTVTTVRADSGTKVLVLVATRLADIGVGAPVAVYGDKQSDGSILATFITGVSLGHSSAPA